MAVGAYERLDLEESVVARVLEEHALVDADELCAVADLLAQPYGTVINHYSVPYCDAIEQQFASLCYSTFVSTVQYIRVLCARHTKYSMYLMYRRKCARTAVQYSGLTIASRSSAFVLKPCALASALAAASTSFESGVRWSKPCTVNKCES